MRIPALFFLVQFRRLARLSAPCGSESRFQSVCHQLLQAFNDADVSNGSVTQNFACGLVGEALVSRQSGCDAFELNRSCAQVQVTSKKTDPDRRTAERTSGNVSVIIGGILRGTAAICAWLRHRRRLVIWANGKDRGFRSLSKKFSIPIIQKPQRST
jgi:hypothetical protein